MFIFQFPFIMKIVPELTRKTRSMTKKALGQQKEQCDTQLNSAYEPNVHVDLIDSSKNQTVYILIFLNNCNFFWKIIKCF